MIKWLLATPPKIGSKWSKEPTNPFDDWSATVVEVKDGWVKYNWYRGVIRSSTIRNFRALYTEIG